MKRHQEILQIIFGIIMLGFICFLLYKFYTIIIQFPIFFGTVGGIIFLGLIYNFRITIAKICLYFNPKIAYNLLKNHLEKGRAVALKKYIFANSVYGIYYKSSKNEREKLKEELEKAENYLTQSLELIKERNEKAATTLEKGREKMENTSKKLEDQMKGENDVLATLKVVLTQMFSILTTMLPMSFKVMYIFFYYSFIKSPKVYYHRGAIRTALEKHQLSLEDFEECVTKEYEKVNSLYGKVYALSSLECYEEALKVINEILEIDSKHNKTIYKRGSIYHKQGNTESACKDWKLAIEYGYTESIDEIEKRRERCIAC